MNKIALFIICFSFLFYSCSEEKEKPVKEKPAVKDTVKKAEEKPVKAVVKDSAGSSGLPVVEAEFTEMIGSEDEVLYGPCCFPGYNLGASSVKPNWEKTSFGIDNIADNDRSTAWIEGEPGYGTGQYIEFDYDFNDTLRACKYYCQYFTILNGYQKSKHTWNKYARVKRFKVYANGDSLCYLDLHDHYGLQFFMLDYLNKLGRNGTVRLRFEIVEIYPGNKKARKETAISELFFSCAP